MSHRSTPVSACLQNGSNSSRSISQIAAADYIGDAIFELAAVARLSRLPLIHYLLCMAWAETHDIVRHMKAIDTSSAADREDAD